MRYFHRTSPAASFPARAGPHGPVLGGGGGGGRVTSGDRPLPPRLLQNRGGVPAHDLFAVPAGEGVDGREGVLSLGVPDLVGEIRPEHDALGPQEVDQEFGGRGARDAGVEVDLIEVVPGGLGDVLAAVLVRLVLGGVVDEVEPAAQEGEGAPAVGEDEVHPGAALEEAGEDEAGDADGGLGGPVDEGADGVLLDSLAAGPARRVHKDEEAELLEGGPHGVEGGIVEHSAPGGGADEGALEAVLPDGAADFLGAFCGLAHRGDGEAADAAPPLLGEAGGGGVDLPGEGGVRGGVHVRDDLGGRADELEVNAARLEAFEAAFEVVDEGVHGAVARDAVAASLHFLEGHGEAGVAGHFGDEGLVKGVGVYVDDHAVFRLLAGRAVWADAGDFRARKADMIQTAPLRAKAGGGAIDDSPGPPPGAFGRRSAFGFRRARGRARRRWGGVVEEEEGGLPRRWGWGDMG